MDIEFGNVKNIFSLMWNVLSATNVQQNCNDELILIWTKGKFKLKHNVFNIVSVTWNTRILWINISSYYFIKGNTVKVNGIDSGGKISFLILHKFDEISCFTKYQ